MGIFYRIHIDDYAIPAFPFVKDIDQDILLKLTRCSVALHSMKYLCVLQCTNPFEQPYQKNTTD